MLFWVQFDWLERAESFSREDSVSISPSFVHSDNDDNNSDNMDISERYNSASPNATGIGCFGAQRSPASSKRYRTHLTPLQVHVSVIVTVYYSKAFRVLTFRLNVVPTILDKNKITGDEKHIHEL